MTRSVRSYSFFIIAVCILGAVVFHGCGGGGNGDDALPTGPFRLHIAGSVTASGTLGSIQELEASILPDYSVSSVEVYLESNPGYTTTTNSSGAFDLTIPSGGTHRVVAKFTKNNKVYKARSQAIVVSQNSPDGNAGTMRLASATNCVMIELVNKNGQPISGANISVWGQVFTSTGPGSYTSPVMPSGASEALTISVPGYQTVSIPVNFSSPLTPHIQTVLPTTTDSNRAPIVSLSADKYYVVSPYTINITANVSDADGDTIISTWTWTAGTLTTQGSYNAIWSPPAGNNVATITFIASDSRGLAGKAILGLSYGTGGGTNRNPLVEMVATGSTICLAQGLQIIASATDQDGDALSYSWTADSGNLSSTNSGSVIWTSPTATGTYRVSVQVSDGRGGTAVAYRDIYCSGNPPSQANQNPIASISHPIANLLLNMGNYGQALTVSGSGYDPEDTGLDPVLGSFTWKLSIDRGGGVLEPHGTWGKVSSFYLRAGYEVTEAATYVISLTVYDSLMQSGTYSHSFRINATPTAQINAPASGAVYIEGFNITFAGQGTDIEDSMGNGLSLVWHDGGTQLSTEATFAVNTLARGSHNITLTALDRLGLSDTDVIGVYINPPPRVDGLITPTLPSVTLLGSNLSFLADVSDFDQASTTLAVQWRDTTGGLPGTLLGSTNPFNTSALTAGTHTIQISVFDQHGMTDPTLGSMSFPVYINRAPVVGVSSPAVGARNFLYGQTVNFVASITDFDETIPATSMLWYADGAIVFNGSSFTKNDFASGTHVISLVASDSHGAQGSTTFNISIGANQAPVIQIVQPTGTTFPVGSPINFVASVSDLEDVTIPNSRILWNADGLPVNIGATFTKSDLASGPHTMQVVASDSQGAVSSLSFAITVGNTPPTVQIVQPLPTISVIQLGTNLTFIASASDFEDGGTIGNPAQLKWTVSNASTAPPLTDSQFGAGSNFTYAFPAGTNTFRLTATDSTNVSASVSQSVFVNTTPTVTSPTVDDGGPVVSASGAVKLFGSALTFNVSVTDPDQNPAPNPVWNFNGNDLYTGFSYATTPSNAGTNTVLVRVPDAHGGVGSLTFLIYINRPPTVNIATPANNHVFPLNSTVHFQGSATDPDTGAPAIATSTLNWYDVSQGGAPLGLGTSTFWYTFTIGNGLGSHTIRLDAADQYGAVSSTTIDVYFNATPTVGAITTNPAPSDLRFDSDTPITFTLSNIADSNGYDPVTVTWYDARGTATDTLRQATIPAGAGPFTDSFTTSLASAPRTIFACVMDNHGYAATSSLNILVNRLPVPSLVSLVPTLFPNQFATTTSGIPVYLVGSTSYNIVLTATGSDYELGDIDAASFTWLDVTTGIATLGQGLTLNQNILPVGERTFRLQASDNFGSIASVTFTFQAWGIGGALGGQVNAPTGIHEFSSAFGELLLCDRGNRRFLRIDSNFNLIASWGVPGSFSPGLADLAVDNTGNIFLTDSTANRITKINGAVVPMTWTANFPGFSTPMGMDIHLNTLGFAADYGSGRVLTFNASTGAIIAPEVLLASPTGLAVTPSTGMVYAANLQGSNSVVRKFNTALNTQFTWASAGVASFSFGMPVALDADDAGRVFVADTANHVIKVLDPNGALLVEFGSGPNNGLGQFNTPSGLVYDSVGKNLYICDTGNNRLIHLRVGNSSGW